MKVITEAMIRNELRSGTEKEYRLPSGMLLSPAAKEYLQQRKISITEAVSPVPEPKELHNEQSASRDEQEPEYPYRDYMTGAFYRKKPENMTHMQGNLLVVKNHPGIIFRGRLDRLSAEIVEVQAIMAQNSSCTVLIEELSDILDILRQIMRSDVMDEPYQSGLILGLSHEELREQSHNPMKYYNVRPMMLPDYKMGLNFAMLNRLRTSVRETETAAVAAYQKENGCHNPQIIEELNRLSSAFHIMMCRCQSGYYK